MRILDERQGTPTPMIERQTDFDPRRTVDAYGLTGSHQKGLDQQETARNGR